MVTVMIYTAFGLILLVAFALLALTQFPHRRATKTPQLLPGAALKARLLAGLLLVGVLIMAIWREGGGFGFLLWGSLLSLSACAVSLILGWWPHLLALLARLMLSLNSRHTTVRLDVKG